MNHMVTNGVAAPAPPLVLATKREQNCRGSMGGQYVVGQSLEDRRLPDSRRALTTGEWAGGT